MNLNANLLKGVKLYTEKEFEGLTPEQKDIHQETVIRKILENGKEGVTAPDVLRLISYMKSSKTVQKYLEKFVNTNFAYKKVIGKSHVYYQNGRLLHNAIEENVLIGDKIYSFFYIKNPSGDFISIQEKRHNELDAIVISGGIMIDKRDFGKFSEYIRLVEAEIKKKGDV